MSAKAPFLSAAVLDDYQCVAARLAPWSSLEPQVVTTFLHEPFTEATALAERLGGFDVIVAMRERTRFDAALLRKLPNLKLIVSAGRKNAAIDVEAANAQGVTVTGTEMLPHATPEFAWLLIMALARNLMSEVMDLRQGGWQSGLGMELHGKTLGILGLGRIGTRIAAFGQAFGMRTIAWSEGLSVERALSAGVERVSKEALFRHSDVLTVHLVLSERSRGLVDRHMLSLMKPSALLVNTSRGPIVSEADLLAALQERRIAGAALDVFDTEPLPADHPFRGLPNVLATPHIGYVAEGNYRLIYTQAVANIAAWLDGRCVRVIGQDETWS